MFIQHFIAVLSLLVSSYIDIKIQEVPDLISNGTIFVGILIAIMSSILELSYWPIVFSLSGLVIGFAIGALMYYTGQWGGGDAKLLMGLGALFGAGIFFYQFIILLIVVGAIYGLIYSSVIAIINRKQFKKAFKKLAYTKTIKIFRMIAQGISIIALISAFFIIQDWFMKFMVVLIAAILYFMIYGWLFSKSLEKVMKKRLSVNKLVEGDWVIEEIKIGKKSIIPAKFGITKKQIAQLKKLKIKTVLIKSGIPFVPSFLLAYLVSIIMFSQGINIIYIFW